MEAVSIEVERDASGRFVPGQSGNPAGKRPGTRNRKTILMEALRDGEGEAVARVIIDKAVAGDAVAARFCLGLISPRPRGRAIHLDLPEDDDCNVVSAFNATLRALANGEITPDEAVTVARFLDGRRRVLQAWQLEERLTSYGRTIPGDPEWGEEEDPDEDDSDACEDDEDWEAEPLAADATPRQSDGAPSDATPPEVIAELAAAPGEGMAPQRRNEAAPLAQAAADLLSACISPAAAPSQPPRPYGPGTIRGMISIPTGGGGRGRSDVRFGPA
jgi:hypothetical protein